MRRRCSGCPFHCRNDGKLRKHRVYPANNASPDSDTYADAYSYAYSYTHSDTHSDTDSDTHADADVGWFPHRLPHPGRCQ